MSYGYVFASPYHPSDASYLTHEDKQYLAARYGFYASVTSEGFVKMARDTRRFFDEVTAEDLVPHMEDPTIRKLAAVLVKEKLKR